MYTYLGAKSLVMTVDAQNGYVIWTSLIIHACFWVWELRCHSELYYYLVTNQEMPSPVALLRLSGHLVAQVIFKGKNGIIIINKQFSDGTPVGTSSVDRESVRAVTP